VGIEVRELRPEEFDEGGRVTAAAYAEFAPGDASPNVDYLLRVADIAARAPHAVILGAFEDGRVVGTVTLEIEDRIRGGFPRPPLEPDEAHVRMLGVAPERQRSGIGLALMEASIERARDAGKRRLTLETAEAMTGAQHMYDRMGFRRGPDWVHGEFRLLIYELAL
jgi:ribosomal protein S18 acetylase RimI-like enzyme